MSELPIDQLIARPVETIGREYRPQQVILFGFHGRGRGVEHHGGGVAGNEALGQRVGNGSRL